MAGESSWENVPVSLQKRPQTEVYEMDDSRTSSSAPEERQPEDGAVTVNIVGQDVTAKTGAGIARHTLGLLLLLFVVLMWTASNFLGSSIFADNSYAKPFFLTYLNTSMFMIAMIPSLLVTAFRKYRDGSLRDTLRSAFRITTYRPLWRKNLAETESEAFLKPDQDSETSHETTERQTGELGVLATARLSMAFCILWFAANYFAMACLEHTTVASATILTSTSSVWTLLIGAITGIEKFTWRKLCGVLASIIGIILISRVDLSSAHKTPTHQSSQSADSSTSGGTVHQMFARAIEFPEKPASELAFGDCLALLSAAIYGFYTITLKKSSLIAAPLELNMTLFFGLVGFFNFVFLSPLFPILHFTGMEVFELPPSNKIWTILVVNSVASLLSDICWAYAMVMTSPLLVTVGLSLTIPLSLVGEMVIQARYEGWLYWVGALIVVGSFVFVEREEVKEEGTEDQDGMPQEAANPGSPRLNSPVRSRRSRDVENDPTTRLLSNEFIIDEEDEDEEGEGETIISNPDDGRKSFNKATAGTAGRVSMTESRRRRSSVGGSYNSISGPEGYRLSTSSVRGSRP